MGRRLDGMRTVDFVVLRGLGRGEGKGVRFERSDRIINGRQRRFMLLQDEGAESAGGWALGVTFGKCFVRDSFGCADGILIMSEWWYFDGDNGTVCLYRGNNILRK